MKLKKIRLFKTPQGICCVVATSLLRATPSTMEPQWSQFNYLAIQERQFCLGLSYQDVLPLVSTKKTNMAHFHKEIRDFQTHNANASAPWPKSKKHEWHDLYLLSPPPPTTAENKKTNNLTLIETTMENAITQPIKFDSLVNPNIVTLF